LASSKTLRHCIDAARRALIAHSLRPARRDTTVRRAGGLPHHHHGCQRDLLLRHRSSPDDGSRRRVRSPHVPGRSAIPTAARGIRTVNAANGKLRHAANVPASTAVDIRARHHARGCPPSREARPRESSTGPPAATAVRLPGAIGQVGATDPSGLAVDVRSFMTTPRYIQWHQAIQNEGFQLIDPSRLCPCLACRRRSCRRRGARGR
jgi:hypothetical protein